MGKIKLDRLRPLYKGMTELEEDHCMFTIWFKNEKFRFIYTIDQKPNELLVAHVGGQCAFNVKVYPGFLIETFLEYSVYSDLCEALNLKKDPDNPFSTKKFFEEVNSRLPSQYNETCRPKPQHLARHRSGFEEEDRIYFWHWRSHKKNTNSGNVTLENFHKTKKLMGSRVAEKCWYMNVSTVFTGDPNLARDFDPEELDYFF